MPKYTVLLTRMVEEIAEIEVEANGIDDALKEATDKARSDWPSLKTEPGDMCDDPEAYAARDASGEICWERTAGNND